MNRNHQTETEKIISKIFFTIRLYAVVVLLFFLFLVTGCGASQPLVIEWPNVVQQCTVPQSNQGVVVTAPKGVWLDVMKASGYGTTAFIFGMPPGQMFFVSADATLTYSTTVILTVRGRDAKGNLIGVTSRPFTFSNMGYYSYNQYWNVTASELH